MTGPFVQARISSKSKPSPKHLPKIKGSITLTSGSSNPGNSPRKSQNKGQKGQASPLLSRVAVALPLLPPLPVASPTLTAFDQGLWQGSSVLDHTDECCFQELHLHQLAWMHLAGLNKSKPEGSGRLTMMTTSRVCQFQWPMTGSNLDQNKSWISSWFCLHFQAWMQAHHSSITKEEMEETEPVDYDSRKSEKYTAILKKTYYVRHVCNT